MRVYAQCTLDMHVLVKQRWIKKKKQHQKSPSEDLQIFQLSKRRTVWQISLKQFGDLEGTVNNIA